MKKQYEGMFLVSPTAGDGEKVLDAVKHVLGRAEAEVMVCKKWDERKLAYEIGGQKRGTYVLTYFRCEGGRIADIERDVQLSDELLRVLVLTAEDMTEEQMNKPTPAETGQSPQAELPSTLGDRPFRPRGDRRSDRPFRRDDGPDIQGGPEQDAEQESDAGGNEAGE